MKHVSSLGLFLLFCLAAPRAGADQAPLRLGELQRAAVRHDARHEAFALQSEGGALRVHRNDRGALPQFELSLESTRQSDAIEIPFSAPGSDPVTPPKDRWDASLGVRWSLWDGGGRGKRSELERKGVVAQHAALEAEIFDVRQRVNAVFFQALVLQEQFHQTQLLMEDLDARIRELQTRVEAGAALPADLAYLRAERLSVQQNADRIASDRRAAFDVLGDLTGRVIPPAPSLEMPRLSDAAERIAERIGVAGAALPDSLRIHPGFAALEAQRAQLDQRVALARTRRMPRASAFGDLSYANPGQRQFPDEFHEEWRVGLRVDWIPWDWGALGDAVDELRVEQRLLDVQEENLARGILRATRAPLRDIQHLHTALRGDAEILALREKVEASARTRFAERAISASDYVEARTDLLQARVQRARHAVELTHAQADLLLTLGREIDDDDAR